MKNPFLFSGVVKDEAFCNREKEQAELKKYIMTSQNVLLYSHRRYGKTSLILKIIRDLGNVTPIYVDLYATTSVEDFISALLKGISTIESKVNKLAKMLKEAIGSLTINFAFDEVTEMPVAIPVFHRQDKKPAIDEILRLIDTLSKKKRMVVAFDEFQEVANYGGDVFEKHLRKSIQHHSNVAYIFAGSQRHLLTEMFTDVKRAFYKLATSFVLKKIATEDYVAWIQKLYRKDRRKLEAKYIETVAIRCENHPMYVQEFFFHLWFEPECSIEVIDRVERQITVNRAAEYSHVWDSLSLNQKKALKLIAMTGGKSIFSSDNLSRFDFRTASQVSVALDALAKREFVVKNSEYQVQDPMFKRWLVDRS